MLATKSKIGRGKPFLALLLLPVCPAVHAQSPDLAGIAHVAFRVESVPTTRAFYESLGFEQSFEFADAGKPPVSYIKINDRQFIELYGGASDSSPAGLMHVCYEAADIQAVWSEYRKRGLNPPESKKARAGNLLFAFYDPENQLLEYTQYLPGSLHFADRGKHLGARRISDALVRASIPVKEVPSESDFYIQKLGFIKANALGAARLQLPGTSRQEVELELTPLTTKPGVTFAITDIAGTEKQLQSRGLKPQKKNGLLFVVDPDGVIVEFAIPN